MDWSRELSLERIHAERFIGIFEQKYHGILLISLFSESDGTHSTIDQIVKVCCGMANSCPSGSHAIVHDFYTYGYKYLRQIKTNNGKSSLQIETCMGILGS